MKRLSIGKIRGLQQIANSGGVFTICAMDHCGSLPNNTGLLVSIEASGYSGGKEHRLTELLGG